MNPDVRCPTTPAINNLIGSVFLVEPLGDDTEPSVGTEAHALSFGNLPSNAFVGDVANLELGSSSGLAVSVDLEPDGIALNRPSWCVPCTLYWSNEGDNDEAHDVLRAWT